MIGVDNKDAAYELPAVLLGVPVRVLGLEPLSGTLNTRY